MIVVKYDKSKAAIVKIIALSKKQIISYLLNNCL